MTDETGLDDGPPDAIPEIGDAWDEPDLEVPTDLEDIAIVAHEALRAYRTTQGSGSGFPWMHRTTNERRDMIEMVKAIQDGLTDPAAPSPAALGDDTETRLLAAIVKALKP